jgi:uncharacterized protein YkwD
MKARRLIPCLVVALLAPPLFMPGSAAVAPQAPAEPAVERVDGLLVALNDYRASKHLPPLRLDRKLNESAQAKAEHLTAVHYWSHVAPDGTKPWAFIKNADYQYRRAGENLARCFKSGPTVVKGWIKSRTHEAVMTDDYRDIGIGTSTGRDGCQYVVAHFATR